MKSGSILIFDIGKTNKKLLIFDQEFNLQFSEEQRFKCITDEDGFDCDNFIAIVDWMKRRTLEIIQEQKFSIEAINFSTYGASLAYLDAEGQLLTPVYNYLKPLPKNVLKGFYERYGGVAEFSRATASPALDMLNSGLQILWMKQYRPTIYSKIKNILHLPQYLSYCFTGKITSEYTSIGCHTALWDFDKVEYHRWLVDENITLPNPSKLSSKTPVKIGDRIVNVGIGIHDSSASLAPYLLQNKEPFVFISTGTWCINMNPFNTKSLTLEQLQNDCLCYMGVEGQQVKSARLFMGHIHEVNCKQMAAFFHKSEDFFKKVRFDEKQLSSIENRAVADVVFFKQPLDSNFVDYSVDYSQFTSIEEAYNQFIKDLVLLNVAAIQRIIETEDGIQRLYVSGGFTRNEIYIKQLQKHFPLMDICCTEIENSSALGAAMVVIKE